MAKKPDSEFVTREDAATDLERIAASLRAGDKDTRVSFYLNISFRRFPSTKGKKEADLI